MKKALVLGTILCAGAAVILAAPPQPACPTAASDVLMTMDRGGGFFFQDITIVVRNDGTVERTVIDGSGTTVCSLATLTSWQLRDAQRIARGAKRYAKNCTSYNYPAGCADAFVYSATTKDGTVTGWVPGCESYPMRLLEASNYFEALNLGSCIS